MSATLPMPQLPPPLPKRENVIQTFERVYEQWRRELDLGGPAPTSPYVQVQRDDLVALLAKVERFAKYGATPEADALIWRVRTAAGFGREG